MKIRWDLAERGWDLAGCGWDLAELWMRFRRVVRASDSQCRGRNCPGFDPSILRQSGIWGAADETVLNTVPSIKNQKIPLLKIGLNNWYLLFLLDSRLLGEEGLRPAPHLLGPGSLKQHRHHLQHRGFKMSSLYFLDNTCWCWKCCYTCLFLVEICSTTPNNVFFSCRGWIGGCCRFQSSIFRHSGIRGAADEILSNKVPT